MSFSVDVLQIDLMYRLVGDLLKKFIPRFSSLDVKNLVKLKYPITLVKVFSFVPNLEHRHLCYCQQTSLLLSADISVTVSRHLCYCQQTSLSLSADISVTVSRHLCHCQQTSLLLSADISVTVSRHLCYCQKTSLLRVERNWDRVGRGLLRQVDVMSLAIACSRHTALPRNTVSFPMFLAH
ncbi:hypothetical protein RRG08_065355 [Elysia crispata]|uniref:Uncharacterized protein n=1 Tax=Elysia crispata TaxID=231223 RepID=A0AAE1AG72_9GAST|nr:hypothetical protein RRG08_065355 [Elysia crispata]